MAFPSIEETLCGRPGGIVITSPLAIRCTSPLSTARPTREPPVAKTPVPPMTYRSRSSCGRPLPVPERCAGPEGHDNSGPRSLVQRRLRALRAVRFEVSLRPRAQARRWLLQAPAPKLGRFPVRQWRTRLAASVSPSTELPKLLSRLNLIPSDGGSELNSAYRDASRSLMG